MIGSDGNFLQEILKNSGVDLTYINRVEQKNGHAIIQVEETGENCIFIYPGTNGMLTEEYIDRVIDEFCAADLLVLQNETNLVPYLIERAYAKGLQIVFNPSPFQENLREIDLGKITYLILNETEAEGLGETEDVERFLFETVSKYPGLRVVLTLGKQGCVYADSVQRMYQPAYCVKAVDTTGAGDTFTGYFVAGCAAGKDFEEVLRYASAASALAVAKLGAAPSIPVMQEVKEALNILEPYKE